MKGKRGWIRILEATIAVLIVSSAMMTIYSEQSVREDLTAAEVSSSFQNQMLSDIAENSSLRKDVLSADDNDPEDPSYSRLDRFFGDRVPDNFDYLVRICDLGGDGDFCKMNSDAVAETIDKDVFVESTIVSSEIGEGEGDEVYSPKKVVLFFWEEDPCVDICSVDVVECSGDHKSIVTRKCGNFDDDKCLEFDDNKTACGENMACKEGTCVECPDICEPSEPVCLDFDTSSVWNKKCEDLDNNGCLEHGEFVVYEECGSNEECYDGTCICKGECVEELFCGSDGNVWKRMCGDLDNDGCLQHGGDISIKKCNNGCLDGECVVPKFKFNCRRKINEDTECDFFGVCGGYDEKSKYDNNGWCGLLHRYKCWDWEEYESKCLKNPSCGGDEQIGDKVSC